MCFVSASAFPRCQKKDPNLNACLTKALAAAMKHLIKGRKFINYLSGRDMVVAVVA